MAESATAARIRESTIAQLREECPYMKTAAIEKLADHLAKECQAGIEHQLPEIEAAKARTSFFSLPPEIRNTIYELAVTPSAYSNVPEYMEVENSRGVDLEPRVRLPSILSVNRQVRQEALPIYYGQNTFGVYLRIETASEVRHFDVPETQMWLRSIGTKGAAMVKNLMLELQVFPGRRTTIGETICARTRVTRAELDVFASLRRWNKSVIQKALPAALTQLGLAETSIKVVHMRW